MSVSGVTRRRRATLPDVHGRQAVLTLADIRHPALLSCQLATYTGEKLPLAQVGEFRDPMDAASEELHLT